MQSEDKRSFDRTVPSSNVALNSISSIVRIAKAVNDIVCRVVVGGVTNRQRKDFTRKNISVDASFIHSIDNSAIIHNQKRHGNRLVEASRGQIEVVATDYFLIPDILENYDTLEKSPHRNKQGKEVIIYSKAYQGFTIYYLEEVRNNRKSLALLTMYKKKNGIGSSDGLMLNTASPSTPKAPSDNSVSVSDDKDNQ